MRRKHLPRRAAVVLLAFLMAFVSGPADGSEAQTSAAEGAAEGPKAPGTPDRPVVNTAQETAPGEGGSSKSPPVPRSAESAEARKKAKIAGKAGARDKRPDDARNRETIALYRKLARELHEAGGNGDYDKAIEIYNRILEIDPGDKDAPEGIRRATKAKAAEERLGK